MTLVTEMALILLLLKRKPLIIKLLIPQIQKALKLLSHPLIEGESTDPEVSTNDTVPVREATDDPTNSGEVTNFPTMKDETTVQSITEATTNGSDNVVEDFTSAEILPESILIS